MWCSVAGRFSMHIPRFVSVLSFTRATLLIALSGVFQAANGAGPVDSDQGWHFSFSPGRGPKGYTHVPVTAVYSAEAGYGYEPGASVFAVERDSRDRMRSGFTTSSKPFYFSVAVPEGNYRVTVTLGDITERSETTVKAELRRLMLESVRTVPGELVSPSFIVNVRRPLIGQGPQQVALKPREQTMEVWAWDEKLTLEFNGARPSLAAIDIVRVDAVPTIYLLGDSTVCDQPREPWASWGQMLPAFFKPEIAIANHAESGESLRSSRSALRFEKIISLLKAGDTVLIQFAHNDEKERTEGAGPFTSYKAALERLVDEVRQHGAVAVLVTPMHRRTFDASGRITNSHGDYPAAMRQVAEEKSVALIDLLEMSKAFYEALGRDKSAVAFSTVDGKVDGTHHNAYGSYELAKCVVAGLVKTGVGAAKHLKNPGFSFDPSKPDPIDTFDVPPSPVVSEEKPYGN